MSESDKLRISEIFTSIQGEGTWLGVPSTFLRVSGCNMRCVWCDTPYSSWQPEGEVLSIEQILAKVGNVQHVVVTGGEPMLFPAVESLCLRLKDLGHVITIETAGTVYRDLPCDLMSISPKLANSTPGVKFLGQVPDEDRGRAVPDLAPEWRARHEATRLNREPMKQLVRIYNYQLKFVVGGGGPDLFVMSDLSEIEAILQDLGADPNRVLLMAEGTDSDTLRTRSKLLVNEVIQRGWRLTPRWHVDLFGNTKGT